MSDCEARALSITDVEINWDFSDYDAEMYQEMEREAEAEDLQHVCWMGHEACWDEHTMERLCDEADYEAEQKGWYD